MLKSSVSPAGCCVVRKDCLSCGQGLQNKGNARHDVECMLDDAFVSNAPLPTFYTSADRNCYLAFGAFKFDEITQSLMLRRYCHLGNCVNNPFSRLRPRTTRICPHRVQLFVGPTRFGFPHSQPLDPPCHQRLLRSETVCGCEVPMRDNRSRIAISFVNEAFPRRCWPVLRSRTDLKSRFGMSLSA